MRKFLLIASIFFVFCGTALSQELLVRHDRYYTEIFLKLDPKTVSSVDKKNGSLVIYFDKKIKEPFEKLFKDRFIKSVTASGNTFSVNLYPDSDVSVVNDPEGIKIVTSARKTNSDIFSSYGIGDPLLSAANSPVEDAAQKEALNRVDRLMTEKRFAEAAKLLNETLTAAKNDFYRQEAMYRLGQAYLLLAQTNDVYLADAYKTFDDFARLYPDNFRVAEAMMKSAEAKERANQLFEAVFTYQKIYDSVPDLETKRRALAKIADLYRTLGQYEKAVEAYQTYLNNFRANADTVLGELGQIYFDLKDLDTAYEYFSQLDTEKLIKDPTTTPKRLYSVAETMEKNKKYPVALKLYQSVYDKFPDAKEGGDAIFKSADILRLTGKNNDADMLLLKLKNTYPDKEVGQQAAVEYAKKYLNTKPSDYWKDYFKDMLSGPDNFSLHNEAKYLIIKTMAAEKQIDNTIGAIDSFLVAYPSSKYFKELDKVREDFTFIKGDTLFKQKDYQASENLLRKFNSDYPESLYKPKVDVFLADIRFEKASKLYKENKFKDAADEAEKFIAEAGTPAGSVRWLNLLDNASYKYMEMAYNSGDYPTARARAKQYLTSFPNGMNASSATSLLENSIRTPLTKSYDTGNLRDVTNLYDANADWINKIKTPSVRTELGALAGLSAYKLGAVDSAKKLYSSLTPAGDMNYALLGMLTGDKNLPYAPNGFDGATFEYLIGELKKSNPEYALKLVKLYNKDMKLSARLEYDLAKSASSDIIRQGILSDVYDIVSSNENARFPGSADVFLDMGALSFNKNDFNGAIIPLKRFIDEYKTLDDKRAEALYYMGKAFVNMNDKERGFQYFNEIIETMPQSIYAGIAKSEMEEKNWRDGIKR